MLAFSLLFAFLLHLLGLLGFFPEKTLGGGTEAIYSYAGTFWTHDTCFRERGRGYIYYMLGPSLHIFRKTSGEEPSLYIHMLGPSLHTFCL